MKINLAGFNLTAMSMILLGTGLGSIGVTQSAVAAQIEEVVVMARKREESASDIPIAITAMGEANIEALGATAMSDLVANVPNLAVDPNGNSLNSWGMRGIVSVTRNAGQESGLGVYIDGVYAGRPASFNFPLNDIQQVEVLRGPQGSLFGRNTIAGAINITTKKPGEDLQGEIKASLGNYSKADLQASLSGPLIDGLLSAKVSGFSFQRDGYIDNLFNGDEVMDDDRKGGRFGLYWTPNDNLDITVAGDYLKQNNKQLFGIALEPQLNNFIPDWFQGNDYKVNQNDPNKEKIESGGVSLTVNWQLPSGFTLTSITAQRFADFELFADDDAGPITLTYSHFEDDSDTFSQELRLTSPTGDHLDYLLGFYYLDQEVAAKRETPLVTYPDNSLGIFSTSDVNSKAWAVFATANLYLTDALRLSVGLRYTNEEKESNFTQLENVGLGFPNVTFNPDLDDDALSGDISLTYAINDNINVYGSIRQGAKSGGFQTDIIDFSTEELFVFGPEEAISYELGLKGTFFDKSLQTNIAVFRTDYEDIQVGQLLGLGFTTTNAGESEINGLELEVNWLLTDNLSLGFSAGLLDHEYTKYDGCSGPGSRCDGNSLQLVSDWTVAGTLDYHYPLNNGAAIGFHVDWSARDEYFTDAVNDPDLMIEERSLVNARIGYIAADERYSIYLWGKNLADNEYDSLRWKYPVTPIAFGAFDPSLTGLERLVGEPLTYGIEVAYRF